MQMDYVDEAILSTTTKAHAKQMMAVLAGPTRSCVGWANVKLSKLSRSARRYIILRSSTLSICASENPRSQISSIPITGASMILTCNRYECLIRTASHRISIQWPSESDLRTCRAAFEFANRRIDDYYKLVTHRQLGKGRNSEVVFAFDTTTGDHAAVKIINKDKVRFTDREFAEKEVIIRMTVQHPCIVQTLDIFETPYDLFVVMELMPGASIDRRMLKYEEPLTEFEARIVMRRLFAALHHLHSRNIVHRNVKPQNLYLDSADDVRWPYTVKLSDFSLACYLDDPDAPKQIVGTPEYLAPCATIMSRTEHGDRGVVFATEVDMWAAGVTLYNLLSLQLPFEGEYPPDVFKKVRVGRVSFGEPFDDVSDEAISLIRGLLNVDRRKRFTAQTVLLHPWFDQLREAGMDGYLGSDDAIVDSDGCGVHEYDEYALSDGIRRFRAAATAVITLIRLSTRTPLHSRRTRNRGEKMFQFNMSGVNIAPLKTMDTWSDVSMKAKELLDGNLHVVQGRPSGTVMSRVSTGSTVKSRSSGGTDSGRVLPMPSTGGVQMERTDTSVDYFGNRMRRREATGAGTLTEVHRLMSDTSDLLVADDDKALRRRRRKVRS